MSYTPQQWYVEVSGQIYGPYTSEHMSGFVKEGRIIAQSKISHDPQEGFYAAEAYPSFKTWQNVPAQAPPLDLTTPVKRTSFAEKARAQSFEPSQIAQSEPQQYENNPAPKVAQASYPSVFIVMAEINSGQAMKFLHALQKLGVAQRVGDTLWLVRSDKPLQLVRDNLGATLQRTDRLFILDSRNNAPAWHNIGADIDKRIREFWDQNQ